MIKTKYEVRVNKFGEEYCVTPCPAKKYTMGVCRIMVGSCNCPHCKLYISDDKENQVLTCNADRSPNFNK